MWSHSICSVLITKTKTYLIHLPWSTLGFCFSLSSFPSWSLITIITCPSSSPWISHCAPSLGCTNLAHDHTWWHRLVLMFHQLSKTKLGLSLIHRTYWVIRFQLYSLILYLSLDLVTHWLYFCGSDPLLNRSSQPILISTGKLISRLKT
jgi:hypothetical protein